MKENNENLNNYQKVPWKQAGYRERKVERESAH
jgi:hypothetical protein